MIITDAERQERFLSQYQQMQNDLQEMFDDNSDSEIEEQEDGKKTLTTILSELDRMDSYCDDSEEFESSLNELREKVESIIKVLKSMDKRIEDVSSEIAELQKVKKVVENKRKNLEDYLKINLTNAKFNEVVTDNFKLTIKPSTALVVDDRNLDLSSPCLKPYLVEKRSVSFDKMKIKEDLKSERLPRELRPYFYISEEKNMNFKWRT